MYKICSLFAGVGGIDLGFLETNKCEIAYELLRSDARQLQHRTELRPCSGKEGIGRC